MSANSTGTVIVLASHTIPAGATINSDDIVEARVHGDGVIARVEASGVIGKRTAVPIAEGEQIVAHDVDFSAGDRASMSIPLGIEPAHSIASGSRVQLWFVATDNTQPPTLVAADVIVEAIRAASFGGGSTIDASIASRENNAVLAALGGKGIIVATAGSPSS